MDLRVFLEPQQGASYQQQLRVARTAEDAGYDAFFRSDHLLRIGEGSPLPGPTESWTTLAGIAVQTSRIRLGTLVTSATFRRPGVLAVQVAQVDAMSGGRAELGLGAGWFEAEHAAYGIPFPPTAERFDRLAEQLEIVTGLFGTPAGSRFDFDGKHYRLSDSPALPRPVQSPFPIIMGGKGPKRTPQLAARFASEFNGVFTTVEDTGRIFDGVRAAMATAGRDASSMTWSVALTMVTGRHDAEVARRAAAIGRDVEELRAEQLGGTPAELVDKLGRYAELGVTRVYLQVLDVDDLEHIEFAAAELAPQLR